MELPWVGLVTDGLLVIGRSCWGIYGVSRSQRKELGFGLVDIGWHESI